MSSTSTRWARRRRDVQMGLLFAVIVAGAVAVVTISLIFPAPGQDGFFSYDSVRPDADFHWAFLTLVAANIVLTVVAVGLASLSLVPTRGWPWATAGVALSVAGAAFYAIGVGGWAMTYFFAASSAALEPATANAFVDSINADAFRLFAGAFAGAILVAIGTIITAVGLWLSGNLPKWIAALAVAGSILPLLIPVEGVVGAAVEAPQAVASVMIGWHAWRLRHQLTPETPTTTTAALRTT